jgi:hypothetical protein
LPAAADAEAADAEAGGAQVGDAQVEVLHMAAEAFLAVEAIFREEVAISLEVTAVFPAVAAVSLGVAVFLPAAEVLFPGAAAVDFQAEAAAVPLETALRTILHCFPISADRARVAVECHRVQPEVNPATVVQRWEEAQHSCHPAIGRVVTSEIDPRKFPLAMKAQEHVEVMLLPNVLVGAMRAIFSGWPAGSALALLSARQP